MTLAIRLCVIVLLAVALPVAGSASQSTNASQDSTTSTGFSRATLLRKAKEWFMRFQSGKIDRSQLSATVNAQLSEANIRQEAATLSKFGSPTSFEYITSEMIGNARGYKFLVRFHNALVIESIAFDQNGLIAGVDFQPFLPK